MVRHFVLAALLLSCVGLHTLAARATLEDAEISTETQQDTLHLSSLAQGSVVFGRFKLMQRLWPPANYKLDHELGRGQFGIAYTAVNIQSKEKVVLKVFTDTNGKLLRYSESLPPANKKRLDAASKECQACSDLINAGEDAVGKTRFMKCIEDDAHNSDQECFIVLEHIDGQTLEQWAKSYGEFDYPPAADLTRVTHMLLEGLRHIEGKFVHRDIKPDNVMVWKDAAQGLQLKYIDFGFVAAAGKATDVIAGAPGFRPPEMLRDQMNYIPTSHWDVWSVGVMIYQMLCEISLVESFSEETGLPSFPPEPVLAKVAVELEDKEVLRDTCTVLEDLESDHPKLAQLLNFVLDNILVKESERKKASELLENDIFK